MKGRGRKRGRAPGAGRPQAHQIPDGLWGGLSVVQERRWRGERRGRCGAWGRRSASRSWRRRGAAVMAAAAAAVLAARAARGSVRRVTSASRSRCWRSRGRARAARPATSDTDHTNGDLTDTRIHTARAHTPTHRTHRAARSHTRHTAAPGRTGTEHHPRRTSTTT